MSNIAVHKVIFPKSGKVVLVREMTMQDEEIAATQAAKKAGDNALLMGYHLVRELMKILIVQINDKELTAVEKESLVPKHLTRGEYGKIREVIEKLQGEDLGECQIEFVPTGANSPG